jgi:hypothetical protein
LNIQLLTSEKIDKEKWNECVRKSANGFIYAHTIYLCALAGTWSGIVINDYEGIVPLPWKKKWGIAYLCGIPFVQQLGLIGNISIDAEILFNKIFSAFRYGNYFFNYSNAFAGKHSQQKTNYILPLNNTIEKIKEGYAPALRRNLSKAFSEKLSVEIADIKTAAKAFENTYKQRLAYLSPEKIEGLIRGAEGLQKEDKAFALQVCSKEKEPLAFGLFLKDGKRIYNVAPTTLPAGRNVCAMHFLIHSVLEQYAGSGLIFDFEGSENSSIGNFYKKFGAINQPYYLWKFNRLPAPIKWIKK